MPMDRRALGLPVSPPWPWDDNDTSKYSLVEIAVEFIMWDATDNYSDEDRCRFNMLAIQCNFPHEEWEARFKDFPNAYEQGLVREPQPIAEPVENIRQLIQSRPLGTWLTFSAD